MNINRNNYEEYFLLYADNELTQTERRVVEIFVQENVDLKEEFLMIQLTVNSPSQEMKLADKSFLLKTELAFSINENNYEEIFVLYYDNELSEEQKKETENFVANNLIYKNDFELIGKAKLTPEKQIVYPNKQQLYQKQKTGKVIPLVLWRVIAAAAFIGFGLWIIAPYFNNTEKNIPVASKIKNAKQQETIERNSISKELKEQDETASSSKSTEVIKIKGDETEIKKPVDKQKSTNNNSIVKTDLQIKKSIVNQKPGEKPIQNVAVNLPLKRIQPEITINKTSPPEPVNTMKNVEENNFAQSASYVPEMTQEKEDYVFYDVSVDEFRKSKVGGFLKKVKRIVERNNPITRILTGNEEQIAAK